MKKRKQKNDAVPLEFIQEINKLGKEELTRRFLEEENDINALIEQKKSLNKFKKEDEEKAEDNSSKEEVDPDASLPEVVRLVAKDYKAEIERLERCLKSIYDAHAMDTPETESEESEDEPNEDLRAQRQGFSGEIKRRRKLRNYLYEQMNVAYKVQMVARPR